MTRTAHSVQYDLETAQRERGTWTVVLDDDPTGTQTVRELPVVMRPWRRADLVWAAGLPGRTCFLLTNSRALGATDAAELTRRLVRRAASVAAERGLRPRVVSRSDSTLRGHFGPELAAVTDALREGAEPVDGIVFVPAFPEAGRYTVGDVQWVRQGGRLVPAAETEFAGDATFGYRETDLLAWMRNRLPAGHPVGSLGVPELRAGGAAARLAELRDGAVLLVNAERSDDLEALALGVVAAERAGARLAFRTAPSYVRLCAAQPESRALSRLPGPSAPGLTVVGSHTALTNAQLSAAVSELGLNPVELSVPGILDSADEVEIERCAAEVAGALAGGDVVLRTSRRVHHDPGDQLRVSRAVSAALVAVVRRVLGRADPGYLVAKGGITSSDLVTEALGASRALVAGQVFPGQLSVWRLLDGARPGLPYLVFPGNVGGPEALVGALRLLRGDSGR